MLHPYLSLFCSFYVQRRYNENQHRWNVERYLMKKSSIFIYMIPSIVLLAFKIPNALISYNWTYTTWPMSLQLPLYPTSPQGNVWAPLLAPTQQWSSRLLILCTPVPSALPHRYQPHGFTTDGTTPPWARWRGRCEKKIQRQLRNLLCVKDLINLN